MTISLRKFSAFPIAIVALAVLSRTGDGSRAIEVVSMVASALSVYLVPGVVALLWWMPRQRPTLLDVLGWGVALSFALVQLLTVACVMLHLSAALGAAVLLTMSVLGGAAIAWRNDGEVSVSIDQGIVFAGVVLVGVTLYVAGSPVTSSEDQIHAAVVRRLAHLDALRTDNLYFVPGLVFSYPLPGTHFSMALVSLVGNIDPLFVYHKLRFLWGPAALLLMYLAAGVIFGSPAIAAAVTLTAVVFVYAGLFSAVPGFSWGWAQLTPYSHPSDVAMTVLLPALLVVALEYIRGGTSRERMFFFATASALVFMLTAVHVREAVQFFVYCVSFALVCFCVKALNPYARRSTNLAAIAVLAAVLYGVWAARLDPLYADAVNSRRADLAALVSAETFERLLLSPTREVLADFVPEFDRLWDGIIPILLCVGPAVIVLFRSQPAVWLVCASTLTYLVLMVVPAAAASYIYFTYYEILYTPVRNVVFFAYMFAGAALYVLGVALARVDRFRLLIVASGAVLGALAAVAMTALNRSQLGFFVPLIAAYAVTMFVWQRRPGGRLTALTVSIIAAGALVAMLPEQAPVPPSEAVNLRWHTGVGEDERHRLEDQFSLTAGEEVPGSEGQVFGYRLMDVSEPNVRAIVMHPAVADTHHIDRQTFVVESQPPAEGHRPFGARHLRVLQYPGWLLFVVAIVALWFTAIAGPALVVTNVADPRNIVEYAARGPFHRWAGVHALLLIPCVVLTARPELSPLADSAARGVVNSHGLNTGLPCITTTARPLPLAEDLLRDAPPTIPVATHCPPDHRLVEWLRRELPSTAVLAIDLWNPYLPSIFTPHAVTALPFIDSAVSDLKQVLNTRYAPLYEARLLKYQTQPFFNDRELPAERSEFVQALGVTHILVDPAYRDVLRPILDNRPEEYIARYDAGEWSVYEVSRALAQ